jgi:hypothetical protein
MSESAADVNGFFRSGDVIRPSCAYTGNDRSGIQGSAGRQPERRLRGQDQSWGSVAELSPKTNNDELGLA